MNFKVPNLEQFGIIVSDQWISEAIDIYSLPIINSIKNRLHGIDSISKVKDKNAIRYKIALLKDFFF